ncbi:MAG: Ger(x)C family spore germination C-terminal domain-containing protein [Candidatus Coproplasma sp.]
MKFKRLKKLNFSKLLTWFYALIIVALTFLFFTNDFGLVDIRKTSVIVGTGLDVTENGIKVTAQLAVPQPSENGENTQFTEVEGEGKTVADALKEINAKTGFYPKLIFCKLIVLGESCKDRNIFELLDYFYRNEYTQLTPVVAMCKGEAGRLLGEKLPFGNTATVSIGRILSDEGKKSGNVSTVNLKIIGEGQYSPSGSCYMPYIESKTSGGEQSKEEGGASGGSSGEQGGSSSGGSSGGQSGSQGDSGGSTEFLCNKTAIFKDGKFVGILDEEQAFALNLINNEIRHVFVPCESEGDIYTVGLRNCNGGLKLSTEGGTPRLKVSFSGTAQVQDVNKPTSPEQAAEVKSVSDSILNGCRTALMGYFDDLIKTLKGADCDALGIKKLLYRYNYSSFEKLKDGVLQNMQVEYDVNLKSSG